ncbi:hypothetical protein SAMN06265337_1601 [Hymenobacter gelipurpurascens]|uniref:Uncharacterized protein n=1 Tax=Hymenobacter gelipurpurascens TaxID=89968 RepID=A0A212TK13_9BACT|nr:hypothetical protein [Hymenobacter gelipurpurascens]SNC66409.1 hypothetical protein SAMN06265337_1601 [Hymenobacter gelipurpurascens]
MYLMEVGGLGLLPIHLSHTYASGHKKTTAPNWMRRFHTSKAHSPQTTPDDIVEAVA